MPYIKKHQPLFTNFTAFDRIRPGGNYFSQPRFLKYHIGTSALATIRLTV